MIIRRDSLYPRCCCLQERVLLLPYDQDWWVQCFLFGLGIDLSPGLFDTLMRVLDRNGSRYTLMNSAILDLLDYIRKVITIWITLYVIDYLL